MTEPAKLLGERSVHVQRRVLREQIKEHLIDEILSGRLRAGERIAEVRLALELGVSQGPVREALRDLDLLGFIVSSPFRGTWVREITPEELVELYHIRAVMEGVAGRCAAPRITPAELTELERLVDEMRAAAQQNDRERHARADIAFHAVVFKASGNRLLQHFWNSTRLATTTFVTQSMGVSTLNELAERHMQIIRALREQDSKKAEAALQSHIEEPGEWVRAVAAQHHATVADASEAGND